MLLKSLALKNIRSYTDHSMEFPSGSVLLAGDIGAGKSSILYAVEFALFGIKRGELSGQMLLRHGKNEGHAELALEVEGKEVIIKRTLKRIRDEVKQDSGYIIIGGRKKEGSPTELRAEVLSLLGYPKELLNRPNDLLYRFTVYTPQEEMKAILTEDKDARLDTLRKVFNIDKYKNIASNSSIIAKDLRDKRKLIEARISDLQEKIKLKESLEGESAKLGEKISEKKPLKEEASRCVALMKDAVSEVEGNIRILMELRKDMASCEVELANMVQLKKKGANEAESLSKEIETLQREVESFSDIVADEKQSIEKLVQELEHKSRNIITLLSQLKTEKSISEKTRKNIIELETCPTCLQNVPHEHKGTIASREDEKIREAARKIAENEDDMKAIEERLKKEKLKLEEIRKRETRKAVIKVKAQSLNALKERHGKLSLELDLLREKIRIADSRKNVISGKINGLGDIEENYKKIKKDLDAMIQKERALELELVSLEKQNEGILKQAESLRNEVEEKKKLKEKIQRYSDLQNWLDDFFVNLANTMERHVMAKIQLEFNELFQRWFGVLLEDESISDRKSVV